MTISRKNTPLKLTALAAALLALSACGGGSNPLESYNLKPAYLGAIVTASYDGNTDDLLTAGLGKTGLGAAAPSVADPAKPTPAELRKLLPRTRQAGKADDQFRRAVKLAYPGK